MGFLQTNYRLQIYYGASFLQVLTSCNNTKKELVEEFCSVLSTVPSADGTSEPSTASAAELLAQVSLGAVPDAISSQSINDNSLIARDAGTASVNHGCDIEEEGGLVPAANEPARHAARPFELIDWVKTYPTFRFGGIEGTRVCTVAFRRLP